MTSYLLDPQQLSPIHLGSLYTASEHNDFLRDEYPPEVLSAEQTILSEFLIYPHCLAISSSFEL